MGFIIKSIQKIMGVSFWVKPVTFVPLNQFQDCNFQVTWTAAFWTPEIFQDLWGGQESVHRASFQPPPESRPGPSRAPSRNSRRIPYDYVYHCLPMDLILIPYCLGKSLVCWGCFHPRLCLILSFSPHLHHVDNHMLSLRYPAPLFCDGYQGIYSLYGKTVTDGSSTSAVYLVIYTLLRGETSKFLCVNARPIFCEIWGPNVSLSCWWNCNFGNPMRYLCKGT